MICPGCGVKVDDDAIFCFACGTKLTGDKISNEPTLDLKDEDSGEEAERTIMYGFSRLEKAKAANEELMRKQAEADAARAAEMEARNSADAPSSPEYNAEPGLDRALDAQKEIARANAENEARKLRADIEAKKQAPALKKVCPKCGAANAEDDAFCYNCGGSLAQVVAKPIETPVEAPVEALIEKPVETPVASVGQMPVPNMNASNVQSKFCPFCGTPNSVDYNNCMSCGKRLDGKSDKKVNGKITGKPVKIIGILVAAVAAILLLVIFAPKIINKFNKSTKPEELIYYKNSEIVRYNKKSPRNNQVIDEVYDPNIFFSADGKKMYYMSNGYSYNYDLYVRVLDGKRDSWKVASDISQASSVGKDKILYIKDGKLYISNLAGDKEKLASDVDYYYVSEDGKHIMYKTYSSDDSRLFYRKLSGGENQKLGTDVEIIDYSKDLKTMYFTSQESLYVVKNYTNVEKLADDVKSCACKDYDDGTIGIYVLCEDEDSYDIGDFFEDDMEEDDEDIREPDISDYQHTETKPSYWGTTSSTVTDDKYYDDLERYEAKEIRDEIRAYIKNGDSDTIRSSILIYCDADGKEKTLAQGPIGFIEIENGSAQAMSYVNVSKDGFEKVTMSEVWKVISKNGTDNYISYYLESFDKEIANCFKDKLELCIDYKGTVCTVDYPSEEYNLSEIYLYTDSKNKYHYMAMCDDGGERDLLKVSYSNTNAEAQLMAEDFASGVIVGENMYYITDVSSKREEGDLYLNGKMIDSDVYRITVGEDKESVWYVKDYSTYGSTICVAKGKKINVIGTDVYTGKMNERGQFAYLSDYSSSRDRGDLYIYSSGKSIKVDEDVSYILYYN